MPSTVVSRPVDPRRGRLRPLGVDEVRITGGFWSRRQQVNGGTTLGHALEWMDRVGWTGNFRAAAEGRLPRDRRGREFSDSEIYKLAEAMSWERARGGGAAVDPALQRLTDEVGAAQEADGYLNTAFGRPGQGARYSDLDWGHELYCSGHLIQAGVAHARAGGDGLLGIARRAADHVCATFGPGGNPGIAGHPVIEMALVELARLTGEQRYLDQATAFVERRGRQTLAGTRHGWEYHQDDVPVREATVLRGHAVRALYLSSGAVDVAVETGDEALLDAVVAQWDATVARRTYLTGGMGAHHADEAFGEDFALPPDRAYSETCAGVASVQLAWRLLLATGQPRFADLAERTLYNVVATAVAPDGRAFFYTNTLHRRQAPAPRRSDAPSPRAASGMRAPWFAVSCCPTNVARTLASLSAYVATTDDDGLQIHQYADAEIRTVLSDGRAVGVDVSTAYPADGEIAVRIRDTPQGPWALSLRVPAWAQGRARLIEPDGRTRTVASGVSSVRRRFAAGDVVRLQLPLEPRWTVPDPRIDAVRGTVAVERGPLVLCLESPDLPAGGDAGAFVVDPHVAPVLRDGRVVVTGALASPAMRPWPYGPPDAAGSAGGAASPGATGADGADADAAMADAGADAAVAGAAGAAIEVPLVAYHDWANRGPSTMRVWLPLADGATP